MAGLNRSLLARGKGEEEFDHAYSDCAQYGKISFWDQMYATETEPFEWYYPYQYFRTTIRDKLHLKQRVLVAGCGSSNMLEDMAADGFEQLFGCDFSRVILNQMQVRCNDLPQISFHLETLTDTNFPNACFQGIIDKAVFDSIICTEDGETKVRQYVNEVERLLTDTGIFILISHSNPDEMLKYLEQYDIDEPYYSPWFIEVQATVKPEEYDGEKLNPDDPDSLYFVYVITMQEDLVIRKKLKAKSRKTMHTDPTKRHKAERI